MVGAFGLLFAFAAALVVWGVGAEGAVSGGFEGEGRDLSVVWVELPLMLVGFPGVVLGVWAVLRKRSAWVIAVALVAALALMSWGSAEWLAGRGPVVSREPGL
ncbi:hypothetical protein [Streptomyces sp. NPDC090025]|uniref:hypothetical protein n=1 Tax=Streptomyces sp. NPDC090025 TaxID=3365922 RepID=UPI0038340AD5